MAATEIGHIGHQLAAHRHAHFRRACGGRSPQVGGMVDQRPVGLVAHGRNQRDHAARRRAHDRLLVEAPQVFQGAAAPRHDDH